MSTPKDNGIHAMRNMFESFLLEVRMTHASQQASKEHLGKQIVAQQTTNTKLDELVVQMKEQQRITQAIREHNSIIANVILSQAHNFVKRAVPSVIQGSS